MTGEASQIGRTHRVHHPADASPVHRSQTRRVWLPAGIERGGRDLIGCRFVSRRASRGLSQSARSNRPEYLRSSPFPGRCSRQDREKPAGRWVTVFGRPL